MTYFEDLKERISTFSIYCSEKLRSQKSNCNSIYVFVKSNRHQKNKLQYRNGIVMTLPYGSNSSITISKYAVEGLKKIYKRGIEYKKAGVIVLGLVPNSRVQLNIFDKENPKHQILMKTLDFITKKEGPSKVKVPAITTTAPLTQFKTDELTVIVRPKKDESGAVIPNEYIDLDVDFEFEFKAKDYALDRFEKEFEK